MTSDSHSTGQLSSRPERPIVELVDRYVDLMDQEYGDVEHALRRLFDSYPKNTCFDHVLWKVCTLNDIYSTQIRATDEVAAHIVKLGIDPELSKGSVNLVGTIANVELTNKKRCFYSFATKYCSWHQPAAYPVYDSSVDWILWQYRLIDAFCDFPRPDLRKYPEFKGIVESFRRFYGLEVYTFKQVDKFLWMYARHIRSKGS